MKRVIEIDGRLREFQLIRADLHALTELGEFIVYSVNDRGFFVRTDGEFIGVAFYGYDRGIWIVSTDHVGGFHEPYLRVRTLAEACLEMWNRREARVRKWRDECDVAEAVSYDI